MILVTGAGGKTGQAVIRQFTRKKQAVRAVARRQTQVESLLALGAKDATVADLLDSAALEPAFEGITAVYHIPPNIHPQEEEIGECVIAGATHAGVGHFIYHSVLRPYIREMPHHLRKARVEERLFTSGLPFTILQPAAYMQNTLAGLDSAGELSVYRVPYPVDTPFSMVDLNEVAEIAAQVVHHEDHFGAAYELSGGEILTPVDIAQKLGGWLGQSVEAEEVDLEVWRQDAEARGMPSDQIDALLQMFRYYAAYGFCGNAHTLTNLLGREPKTYAAFLAGLELPTSD